MHYIDFPEANFSFVKPENTRDDQCGTLKVQIGLTDVEGDKLPVNVSAWKPSTEDIQRINDGGVIYLSVFGVGHPMVSLGTVKRDVEPFPAIQSNNTAGS